MPEDRRAPNVSWEELVAATPPSVRAALPMVAWRIDRLWQLRRPVRSLAVVGLEWLLDLPLWQRDGVRFRVAPRDVLARPDEFPDHLRRVRSADLAYPVHAVRHHGRMVLLDGYHRLARAVLEARPRVEAVVLSLADLDTLSGDA